MTYTIEAEGFGRYCIVIWIGEETFYGDRSYSSRSTAHRGARRLGLTRRDAK